MSTQNLEPNTPPQATHRPRSRWRDELYVIIFEADTRTGQLFDIVLLCAIMLSITVISLETVEYFENSEFWRNTLNGLEWILTLLFTAEYVARLICVRKPLRYAISFFGLIDMLACLPMYLTIFGFNSESFLIVRSIRLLRVFRVLKMMRMLREAHDLKNAIWNARDKVLVFLAVVMVAVTISGTIMYHVEHIGPERPELASSENTNATSLPAVQSEQTNPPVFSENVSPPPQRVDQFTSIPQSMYWAIVTMTTVGYGDIVPRTTFGKAISAMLILLGYSLIIVPTGFVSAEIHSTQHARSASNFNSRCCPNCMHDGHAADARYCRICGGQLVE
ncbi:MAG: ion transporter [Planctomycetales bacterium]|nr:ion transporter [Planctomycetales bacterium]